MSCSERCSGSTRDMSEKMFIFPQETATAHVRLIPKQDNFTAVTVCHRTFTDLTRDHGLFSLATSGANMGNGFLTWWNSKDCSLSTYVLDNKVTFHGIDYSPNKWHSICSTWDSATGLTQMWLDGQPLTIKYTTEKRLTGKPIITLGQRVAETLRRLPVTAVSATSPQLRLVARIQRPYLTGLETRWRLELLLLTEISPITSPGNKDQDNQGGGFDAKQSFVGMMTDVHMWDYVLSPCEIQKFMRGQSFTPGNVMNWAALDCDIKGRVMTGAKQAVCTCFN